MPHPCSIEDSSSFVLLTHEAEEAAAVLAEAQELRLALEIQLTERVRNLTFTDHQHLEGSDEEQLAESFLTLLVSQYSDEALQKALVMEIGTRDADGYTGRYPLHLACDTNAPVEIIQFFLQHEPTRNAVKHKDRWEDLPLQYVILCRMYQANEQVCPKAFLQFVFSNSQLFVTLSFRFVSRLVARHVRGWTIPRL